MIKMKVAAMLGLLAMLCVPPAFAKGETVKIVIEGGDLKAPIETTDRAVLTKFNVWSGISTYSDDGPGFIVDWAKGIVAGPPAGLPRYQVSFYAKLSTDRLAYVVFYEYDPATKSVTCICLVLRSLGIRSMSGPAFIKWKATGSQLGTVGKV